MDDIEKIIPTTLPYDLDAKIFWIHNDPDDEDHDCEKAGCMKISHNDFIKVIKDISGVNADLLGPADMELQGEQHTNDKYFEDRTWVTLEEMEKKFPR